MSAFISIALIILMMNSGCSEAMSRHRPPNILLAISDDQSFEHTSFQGCTFVSTPAFDRIAREGVYFSNCYAGSPGCAPSRSSLVTGRHHWQNEQSGQHSSSWMKKFVPFTDLLAVNGYRIGRTGKGVEPFQYADDDNHQLWRENDAAGMEYSEIKNMPGENHENGFTEGVSTTDYFQNFKYFVDRNGKDKPFFFWYGGREPHRVYEKNSWNRFDKNLADVVVPDFLPDNEVIRGDLLDYAVEIEWFDLHLQRMLEYLEQIGELENTIVIVTSDNGMPFPRAKANCYEYGVHVPLAIRFPKKFKGGRIIRDPVSFIDFAPTLLDQAKISSERMQPMTGESILDILESDKQGMIRRFNKYVFFGRERHSSSRYQNLGYPQRAVIGKDYLYIWNIRSERWPAGAPQRYNPEDSTTLLPLHGLDGFGQYIPDGAYTDIDDGPSKTFLIENMKNKNIQLYFDWAHGKRPEFELYNLKNDIYCLTNLSGIPEFSNIEAELKKKLMDELIKTKDPRVTGPDKEIFDGYKRYARMRKFPEPALLNH